MRTLVVAVGTVLALGVAVPEPAQAQPGGCLKYGLGGAIIGHFAGGHRLKGAALGCALGVIRRRHESNAQYNERIRREEFRQRREYEEDAIARRRGRGDDDILVRRQRRDDDEVTARRPRRETEPDETGAILQRRSRGQDTIY